MGGPIRKTTPPPHASTSKDVDFDHPCLLLLNTSLRIESTTAWDLRFRRPLPTPPTLGSVEMTTLHETSTSFFSLGSGHLFPAFPTPAHCPFLLFCCFLQQKKKHKHRTKNPLVLSATVMTGARKRREMCRDTKQQMGNIEIKEAGPCV